jgi:hypothetical protein
MKRRKTMWTLPEVSDASAKNALHTIAVALQSRISGFYLQAIAFSVAFLMVCARRPDAILNAQFYAEDGRGWYLDAYNYGLHSLFIPWSGYFQSLSRIAALIALLFPLSMAPLAMNICAIAVQILPVNIFLSSRFSAIPLKIRLLGSLVYLAVPNAYEIHANISNAQWHMGLAACLILLAQPAGSWGWRIFDGALLLFTSVSSPFAPLLVPVAAGMWWKRRQWSSALSLALLVPGAMAVARIALHSLGRQVAPNGPSISRLAAILGRQIFLSSLLGRNTQNWFLQLNNLHLVEAIATVAGLAVLLYALRYGPAELKLFVLFTYAVLALALVSPLAGTPDRPQWEWLCVPGCGNRYYFLPMMGFLACLFWMASSKASPRALRNFAVALLLLLPIGIYQDWSYPPFIDLDFSKYAAEFEQAPPGTTVTIPVNPNSMWNLQLTKR